MTSTIFRWIYVALAAPLMVAVGAFFSSAYFVMHFAASGVIVAVAVLGAVAQLVSVEGFGRSLIPWLQRSRSTGWPLALKFVTLAAAYACVVSWTYMGVCLPVRYGGDGGRLPPAVRGMCHKASDWVDAHAELFERLGLRTP